jgi:hypothetical protein
VILVIALSRYDDPWKLHHRLPRPMINLHRLHSYPDNVWPTQQNAGKTQHQKRQWLYSVALVTCEKHVAAREITLKENKIFFFLFHVYLCWEICLVT